jgi:spermidine synthase
MHRRRALLAALSGAPLALGAGGARGEGVVIHRERSLYRDILVYEHEGLRCMKFGLHDAGRQTCLSIAEPHRLVFEYTRMIMGALYLAPEPRRVLVIGLGGGSVPTALRALLPEAVIESVELDPAVVRVAERFFGFVPDARSTVLTGDGRVHVKRAARQGRRFDLVVLDAFDHLYVPEHMITRDYLLEVRSLLADGGVMAANTFSSSGLHAAESATYHSVFGTFFNLRSHNRVILARRGGLPPMATIEAHAARLEPRLRALGTGRDWLLPLFRTDAHWPAGTRLLTDQYSPGNLLNRRD